MSIIVFDSETTGLVSPSPSPLSNQPKMIEFAGIKLNSYLEEIERIEFLVDPQEKELSKPVMAITGLNIKALEGAGVFCSHLEKLQKFFTGCEEIVAHNLMFDHDIILFELQRLDMVTQFPWPMRRTCTVEKTMHIKGFRLNLQKLHNHCFGSGFEDGHRAMVDTEALTKCFIHLRREGVL